MKLFILLLVLQQCLHTECRNDECRNAECRNAECRNAECRNAECRYAECRYAECRYAECRGADISLVIVCIIYFSVDDRDNSNRAENKFYKTFKDKLVFVDCIH